MHFKGLHILGRVIDRGKFVIAYSLKAHTGSIAIGIGCNNTDGQEEDEPPIGTKCKNSSCTAVSFKIEMLLY